jgi:hypothetical protein
MSTFIKTYPRAKVSRHPSVNGWVIDLIQRAGAKPQRVSATYSSIVWADKAARLKLPAPRLTRAAPVVGHGICNPCGRPMRPAGAKAADYPGTTLRQREGLCQPCNQRIKREQEAA